MSNYEWGGMVHRGMCPRMYFRRSSSTKSRTYIDFYKNGGRMSHFNGLANRYASKVHHFQSQTN